MATVRYSCELLRQPLPEKLLTDVDHFRVLQTADAKPIVFCTSINGSLLMIAPDELGQNQVVTLSEKLHFSSPVTALEVVQDSADGTKIYLAAVTQTVGDVPSQLHILRPFQLGVGSWWENVDWPSLPLAQVENSFQVHRLLMASRCDDGAAYPFIAAERSQPGISKRNLARIAVDLAGAKWQWDNFSLTLPFDVARLEDVCVACSPASSGVLYLDKTQGNPSVTFTDLRDPGAAANWFNLPILPNPRSIATVLDRDGFSNVLIAGDGGILHVPAQDWVTSVPPGTIIPPTLRDTALNGAHELRVAQHDKTVTIWAINGSNNIVGQAAELKPRLGDDEIDDLVSDGPTVPLLPASDKIRHFQATVDQTSRTQLLYVLKASGSVSCLHQAGDSKLWTEAELSIPDPEDVRDINTYTCHVHCQSAQGTPTPYTEVSISTSSQIRGAVNGEIAHLSQSPETVRTDGRGDLTIILPANDLAAPTVTIAGNGLSTTSFHPADNAIAKLADTARNGELQDARAANGQMLVPKANAASLQVIGQLHDTFKSRQYSGPVSMSSQGLVSTQGGNGDWSFWHALVAGVEEFASFSYEAGKFIVHTAEAVWSFIVETAEQALKAISAVLEWIGGVVEDVVTWLAVQLDWESILDFQAFLGEFVLTGLDCTEELIIMGGDKLDGWLANGEAEVAKLHSTAKLPGSMANQAMKMDKNEDASMTQDTDNPCYKWVDSKLQDKQSQKSMERNKTQTQEGASLEKIFDTFLNDFLKPLWQSLSQTAGHVWDDLKELFGSDSTITGAEAFKNIGVDILLGVIKAARKSVGGLVAVAIQIVKWIRSVLDQNLEIWCLTKVYRKVTGGVNLTVLNLATLILAVPGAYLFKSITGKKPREFQAIKELLKQCRPLSGLTQKPSAMHIAMMTMSLVDVTVPPASSPHDQKDEHASETINGVIKNSPNLSKFDRLMRKGSMFVAMGMGVWTPIDCMFTSLSWPTALDPVSFPTGPVAAVWMRFQPIVAFAGWVVCTAADMPWNKTTLKRESDGVFCRWLFWAAKGYLNFVKLTTPEPAKPELAGVIGVADLAGYLYVLLVESDGQETDTVLEFLSRLLNDGWAVGSAWNCVTKGAEPYALGAAATAGTIMTVGNMWKARSHYHYWKDHAEDENYEAPTWSNSLSGSLF